MQALACVAVKLEAMAHQLGNADTKWQCKMLPKLQCKDVQRWNAREAHLPKWREEQSHIKVSHLKLVLFAMFWENSTELLRDFSSSKGI